MSIATTRTKRKTSKPIVELSDPDTSTDIEVVAPKKPRRIKPKKSVVTDENDNDASNADAVDKNVVTPSSTSKPTGRSSFWERRKVWSIDELLAETQNIEPRAAQNIVKLFEDENTIPFICRYRRDLVNHMDSDRLRDIKNTYTEIVELRKKAERIVETLQNKSALDPEVRDEMLAAKTSEELEFLYEPYKPTSKGTLAQRAIALGLEEYADRLLFGNDPPVKVNSLVRKDVPDMSSTVKVVNGICNIISHKMSKHPSVLEELRRLRKSQTIVLISELKKGSSTNTTQSSNNNTDASKFENYFDFRNDVRHIKPHQVLAINRGEKLKFLSVKFMLAYSLKTELEAFMKTLFFGVGQQYKFREEVLQKSIEDCYLKKLQPLLFRQVRADLTETASKSSIVVFAQNLKELLLTSPLKGQRILGIDPGFRNGCKLAVISETAEVLETGVIFPHTRGTDPKESGQQLAKLLIKHDCNIIALGNGTACRETEAWISQLYDVHLLDRNKIKYTIVSEQGASVYSCSAVAKKEFPKMDVNEISAVSVARRLNDPLSEYTKIEPRNLGVGMYQHDLNDKALSGTLNEVVSECVSYVGVDINTASLSLLKHVSGLTEKKAEQIIEYRKKNGGFRSRNDLQKVKTIGPKTFVQCAGFIRIEPRSVGGDIINPLDCTWVHPESYDVAEKIISKCHLKLADVGTDEFIEKIKKFADKQDMKKLSVTFNMPAERLEIILIALQRKIFQDYRADLDKRPLFKQGITRATDLSTNEVVQGFVTNVTSFGAFVDIGVEYCGLIHTNHMDNTKLKVGDRVIVSIIQMDVARKRIGLHLENMLVETDTSFGFGAQSLE